MKIKRGLKLLLIQIFLIISLMTVPTHAALTNTHFSDSFKYYNMKLWRKADGWSNGGAFNCTWKDENVYFNNGIMELTIDECNESIEKYSGGEYRTRNKFGYGIYQVRMKPAKNPGIVSSFFVYTGPSDNAPWDEIDIEFLGKDTTKVQFNYFSNGKGKHEYIYDLGFDASEEFHTYGFRWRKDYISWFVDKKEVYRAYSNLPSHPGKIMLNMWPGKNEVWLGKYDGNTPIKSYYDWISYDPFL